MAKQKPPKQKREAETQIGEAESRVVRPRRPTYELRPNCGLRPSALRAAGRAPRAVLSSFRVSFGGSGRARAWVSEKGQNNTQYTWRSLIRFPRSC